MPFTFNNYQPLTPEQSNPFNAAISQALSTYGKGLQAAYAKPNMQQALQKAILENLWNPKIWQSEIGLRGAQAGLAGAEAGKARFLTQNPQYMSPEGMLISQAMGGGRGGPMGSGGGQGMFPGQEAQQMPQNDNGEGGQQLGQGYQPTAQEQQGMSQMQPGQSIVLGGQGNAPQQGDQAPPQSMAYDPNALAFNPPQMPSPTGNPTLDNMMYKKYGMSPQVQNQMDLATNQAKLYQAQNIERNNEFNEQAAFANQSTSDAYKFLDALDRSTTLQRGFLGGRTPAIRDAEQEMESYGNSMAATATQLFKEGNAIHKSDIELQQLAKPNRRQNKDVAFDLAHGVISKNDRLKERQQYYALGNQLGIKPEILDAQWNKYETERPYINTETKMPNDAYKGTWKDYLRPESINSFLSGTNYTPANQKSLQGMNWDKKDLKDINNWAEKNKLNPKEYDKQHLYQYAKEEGISLAALKMELMKRGAFQNG